MFIPLVTTQMNLQHLVWGVPILLHILKSSKPEILASTLS